LLMRIQDIRHELRSLCILLWLRECSRRAQERKGRGRRQGSWPGLASRVPGLMIQNLRSCLLPPSKRFKRLPGDIDFRLCNYSDVIVTKNHGKSKCCKDLGNSTVSVCQIGRVLATEPGLASATHFAPIFQEIDQNVVPEGLWSREKRTPVVDLGHLLNKFT